MPLTNAAADAFGVVTIVLFLLYALLGLYCIFQSLYFRFRIRRVGFLGFFNGPSTTRIVLILLTFWWGIGEIFRSSFVNRRLFATAQLQKIVCNAYVLSNLGFAEPGIFLVFAFLLRGSLQRKESGTLSHRWNRKTILCSFLLCIPLLLLQSLLVFAGPVFVKEENTSGKTKIAKYFVRASYLVDDSRICTYPLFGTIVLGLVDAVMMSYVSYIGSQMLLSVINKQLLRRVSWLMTAVLFLLPLRVVLLGFSVLPHPSDLAFEFLVFLSFLTMLGCITAGIVILVYFPVADSLALGDAAQWDASEMVPFDDYYNDGSSVVANHSFRDIERGSDISTKRGSISFRTMVRDDPPPPLDGGSFSSQGALNISSPVGSSPSAARPMLPLRETPRY